MRQNLFAFAIFASMLPFSTADGQALVQSQEGIALENQILQLQQQVQGLQSSGGGNGGNNGGSALNSAPPPASGAAPDPTVVTSLLTQVQQLETQVQQLNGEVDTLQNQVNTQHDATEKEIGDLKFAMTNGAGVTPGAPTPNGASGAAAGPAPLIVPPPPAAPPASASPKATLRNGELALSKHDYTGAESAARAVLATAKSTPEGYQAQYLLAQSLAGQGRPQDAAIAYDDAYNRDRAGNEAPGSLLGLASSLTAIHQPAAACDTLASLNSQFPTPPAGMATRIAAASRRAHCS